MITENATLTEADEAPFRARGLLRLPGILPTENADRSREEIVRLFEKHGFWKDGRWHQGSSAAFSRLLKRLKKSSNRGGFMTPSVHDAMTELVGGAESVVRDTDLAENGRVDLRVRLPRRQLLRAEHARRRAHGRPGRSGRTLSE